MYVCVVGEGIVAKIHFHGGESLGICVVWYIFVDLGGMLIGVISQQCDICDFQC